VGKARKMGGRRPEGHITDPRNTRVKEMSSREEWGRFLKETRAQKGL